MVFYLHLNFFQPEMLSSLFRYFLSLLKQWRIHEFKLTGAWFPAVEFLGSGDCFDAPLPNVFVFRVGNKINVVNMAMCL